MTMAKNVFSRLRKHLSEYISLLVIIVLVIVITSINPNFISIRNIKNITSDISTYILMSTGVMMVLLLGSIDLSIGAICSLSAVLCATFVNQFGVVGLLIPIAFGIVAGLMNGVLTVFVKIPSFIATLGTMSIWRSLALVVSNSASVSVSGTNKDVFLFVKAGWEFLSVPFLLSLSVLFICFFLLTKTKFGKFVYSTGANEVAARMAGAPVKKTKILAFLVCGLLSALAGILLVAKLKSASPYVGDALQLPGIAAAVLSGISLSGGRGKPLWIIVGCGVVTIITNGISVVSIPSFYQQIVYGVIIMLAIIITADRKTRAVIK